MITNTLKGGIKGLSLALFLFTGALPAGDFADSTFADQDPVADLLDLYAFVDPFYQTQGGVGCENPPDELILALTLNRGASGASLFSDAVEYHFYLDNDSEQVLQIDCLFTAEQVVTCAGMGGLSVQAPVGEVGVSGDIRVFAGLRDDPFFIDEEAMEQFGQVSVPAFSPPGTDTLVGSNVLAIVLDVVGSMTFEFSDCNSASVEFTPGATSLSAFSTEMVRLTDISGMDCQLLTAGQIDRVGRPGIATLLISPSMRNSYNTADDPASWAALFSDEIETGLQALDSADGVVGNGFSDPETLAPVFADDRLQVDIRKGQTGGYFSIEASALVPQDWNIAAGRTLSEDVLDGTLAMLVSAWDPWVGDFVDANDVAFLEQFPFLAAPH